MLKYIRLENFRSFGSPTTVPLAPITLLFGENSAGKSSILAALQFLKQSRAFGDPGQPFRLRGVNSIVDLGSYGDVVFEHRTRRQISISVGIETNVRPALRRARGRGSEAFAAALEDINIQRLSAEWSFKGAAMGGIQIKRYTIVPTGMVDQGLSFQDSPDPQSADAPQRLRFDPACLSPESLKALLHAFDVLAPMITKVTARLWETLKVTDPTDGRNFVSKDIEKATLEEALFMSASRLRSGAETGRMSGSSGSVDTSAWKDEFRRWSRFDASSQQEREALIMETMRTAWSRVALLASNVTPSPVQGEADGFQVATTVPEFLVQNEFLCHMHGEIDAATVAALSRVRAVLDIRRLIWHSNRAVGQMLDRYIPLGPFRRPPERLYTDSGGQRSSVGRGGEWTAEMLHKSPVLAQDVSRWLERFEVGYRVEARTLGSRRSEVFELCLVDTARGGRLHGRPLAFGMSDVGFGVSQILPIIVQVVASQGQLISIEQPEVHIHPRLQAEVAELLAEGVRKHSHQFIVETHSEHLILRIQKLIRNGQLRPADVSVVHVARGKAGARVTQIPLAADGTFQQDWPGGFFPERVREFAD